MHTFHERCDQELSNGQSEKIFSFFKSVLFRNAVEKGWRGVKVALVKLVAQKFVPQQGTRRHNWSRCSVMRFAKIAFSYFSSMLSSHQIQIKSLVLLALLCVSGALVVDNANLVYGLWFVRYPAARYENFNAPS